MKKLLLSGLLLLNCNLEKSNPMNYQPDNYGNIIVQFHDQDLIIELISLKDGFDTTINPVNAKHDSVTIGYQKPDYTELTLHDKYKQFDYSKVTKYPEFIDEFVLDTAKFNVVKSQTIVTAYEKKKYPVSLAMFDSVNLTRHGTSYLVKTYGATSLKPDTLINALIKQGNNLYGLWP